jgi:hypothetical protein
LQRFASHDFYALHAAPADVVLLEAILNPSAQFPRSIVLAARHGSKLQL